jgi:RTX calcium-binding nonapeptide repeat (4 copies)
MTRSMGGEGSDIIVDGAGKDTLTGGEGNDQFVFKKLEASANIITDFYPYDRLVLTELIDSLKYPDSTSFEDGRGRMKYKQDDVRGIETYKHTNGYLQLTGNSGGTIVYVDPDGINDDAGWHKLVGIENVSPRDFINYGLTL